MNRYPTVAEVTEAARRLVSRSPGTGRLRRVGTSRAGRPILMLSVGHGPRHVLVVARPHPDEPVGGATALALAELVAGGDRRSPATDPDAVTWDIVLCLDPDGAALSEGIETATAGPAPTLAPYYRSAFRPVAAEQPEWAPIVGRPLPESRALFDVIDDLRPVLQCSLHNVDAGGAWAQLTRDLPELAAPFAASAAALGSRSSTARTTPCTGRTRPPASMSCRHRAAPRGRRPGPRTSAGPPGAHPSGTEVPRRSSRYRCGPPPRRTT